MTFSSWIYQIAVNCCKNHINSSAKKEILISKEKFRLSVEDKKETMEDTILHEYDMKEFNEAIHDLQDKFRDVFLFRFDHKMKYSEIAEVLNCSERTAKWRMKKAIEKITHHLKTKGVI